MKTKVTFYKAEGGVLAVFPEDKETRDMIGCYAFIGQHHSCTKEYFQKLPLASPEEYLPLMLELIREFKYDLDVFNVRTGSWLREAMYAGHAVWLDGERIERDALHPQRSRQQFQVVAIESMPAYHVTKLNVGGS